MTDGAAPAPKRRFRRRTLRVSVEYEVAGELRCEWATTLGAGGMFIETDDPPPGGTRVKLCFRLPYGLATHEIEGRVVWATGASAQNGSSVPSAGMGIEFTDAVASAALARELEREPEAVS